MDSISPDIPHKQCTNPACKQWFPATTEFFNRDASKRDCLHSRCKQCNKIAKRQYYAQHKHEMLQQMHQHYLEHAEEKRAYQRQYGVRHRQEHQAYIRQHYAQHRQEYISRSHQRYIEHKDFILMQQRQRWDKNRTRLLQRKHHYYIQHKELAKEGSARRRARKMAAPGTFTTKDMLRIYKAQKGKCYYCQKKVKWSEHHNDHIIPLSRGGTNWPDNMCIACAFCNLSKHDKLPHEWPQGGRLF